MSVGKLLVVVVGPGFMLGLAMLSAYIIAGKRQYPRENKAIFKKIRSVGKGEFWTLLRTAIILYDMIGALFTPTEASIMANLYVFIMRIFA